MAAVQRKLVHKQFNSPIGLYSDRNVKETLDRELRAFSNGTVGIELNDNSTPSHLAKSAVLRMLEEEESEKMHPGYKRVEWPPIDGTTPIKGSTPQPPSQNHYQPQSTQAFQPLAGKQSYQQQSHQPQQQYYSQAQPQYSSDRGQSPGIITLRKEAPISQAPAPVFTSQPAARKFKGGSKMRGDLKWPPQDCRDRMAADEAHLLELAKGPACRPTKMQKDYSRFFAQHALNSTYPGYKIPPGTQHMYIEY